jgi:predicted O-methyltransferase YrrM
MAAPKTRKSIRRRIWKAAQATLDARGFYLLRKHYFLPIPSAEERRSRLASEESELVGLDLDADRALAFLAEVVEPTLAEFRESFPLHGPTPSDGFYLVNGTFMAVDAHVLWGIVRSLRPRRIIEIGTGASTRIAAEALTRNVSEGADGVLLSIDPFPPPYAPALASEHVRLLAEPVQDVSLETFASLGDGDVLFIDSTHVLRQAGDVHFEYCEVLPRLAPGVLVHFHDISLPRPYPQVYMDDDLFWNEQYLLQAVLAHNPRYEIVWPGNYVELRRAAELAAIFPELSAMREAFPYSEPASFWIRVHDVSAR